MNLFETSKMKGKSIPLSPHQIQSAWRKVKAAKGSGGVDGMTISKLEQQLGDELYKLWNRMASGSYYPQPVKGVSIPKRDGGERWLGIPTIADRVAQQVVKDLLETELEKVFHPNSYGYRPGKSTHQAITRCNQQCWEKAWAIDLDIKGFFDNLDHSLLMKALEKHTSQKWVKMYIRRWLETPVKHPEKKALIARSKGTPQGGVISPLLANLFLHYAFDKWMDKRFPGVAFERYADDVVIHCRTKQEANNVLWAVKVRLAECKLEAHPTKTKLVYCKNGQRKAKFTTVAFDFLGFRFQPRKAKRKDRRIVLGYVGQPSAQRLRSMFTTPSKASKYIGGQNEKLIGSPPNYHLRYKGG